jgi:hypothetical protein
MRSLAKELSSKHFDKWGGGLHFTITTTNQGPDDDGPHRVY